MDAFKTAIMVLAWTFLIGIIYMTVNVMVYGYVDPILTDAANQSDYVDYDRYVERTNIIKSGFDIACFILILIPYAYLFVRLLLKREKTSPPAYMPPSGGGW